MAQLRQGPAALTAATVHDDGFADVLIGAFPAPNWFCVAPLDFPVGRKANELVN